MHALTHNFSTELLKQTPRSLYRGSVWDMENYTRPPSTAAICYQPGQSQSSVSTHGNVSGQHAIEYYYAAPETMRLYRLKLHGKGNSWEGGDAMVYTHDHILGNMHRGHMPTVSIRQSPGGPYSILLTSTLHQPVRCSGQLHLGVQVDALHPLSALRRASARSCCLLSALSARLIE